MPINYYLQPYLLAAAKTDHKARVTAIAIHDVESITDEMLRRGSTISKSDIAAVLITFFEVVTDEVTEGNHVNLPIANIKPSITGIFHNANDTFDPERHTIKASLTPGDFLRKKVRTAALHKISHLSPQPMLTQFTDSSTQAIDSILTPGSIGMINGSELDFNADNPEEGIFFITDENTALRVTVIATLYPKQLVFSIPASLSVGHYRLEVRKGYGESAVIRHGRLDRTLYIG